MNDINTAAMNTDASEHIFELVKQARIAKYLMQDIMENFFECVEVGGEEENLKDMLLLMAAEYDRAGAKAEAAFDAIFEIFKAAKALEAMYEQDSSLGHAAHDRNE